MQATETRIPYDKRILRYEAEKKKLRNVQMTPRQYEAAIKAIADKWRI